MTLYYSMRLILTHTPGDLITYKEKSTLILTVSRQTGRMDRLELLLPDGSTIWTWAEDTQLKSHLR